MESQKIIQGEKNFKKSLLVGLALGTFGIAMSIQSTNVMADTDTSVATVSKTQIVTDNTQADTSSLGKKQVSSTIATSSSNLGANSASNNEMTVTSAESNSSINTDGDSRDDQSNVTEAVTQRKNITIADSENQGNLDSAKISNNQLQVSGWHATNYANGRNNAYVIVYDATQNKELARQQVTATSRDDVEKVHPNLDNATKSGFNATFALTNAMVGDKIQVVSRYSAVEGGDTDYVDYWFAPIVFNKNDGSLDTVSVTDNGQIQVSGWNANDASWNKSYRYLILYDTTTNKQISSVVANSNTRTDVANIHGDIYQATNSGFSGIFNVPGINVSDSIFLVSRYSESNTGNGDNGKHSDYWMSLPKFDTSTHGSLDTFNFNGTNKLHAVGWQASNQSIGKPYHFIILYDTTTGKQVGSVRSMTERGDVANVYPNIKTATTSGFDVAFDFNSSLIGHNLAIVSRYSSDQTGNGGNGNRVDYWFTESKFSGSGYSIDHFETNGIDPVHVDGWYINDGAAGRNNAYLIVLNSKTGKEVVRQKLNMQTRSDVGNKYRNIYNSNQSGFSVDIPVTEGMSGQSLTFVLRYSGSTDGNSNNADIYSGTYNMPNDNKGSFDNITVGAANIAVSGWHATTGGYLKNYEYLIVVDSSGRELERVKVSNSHQLRSDVANKYPSLYNAKYSGFSATMALTNAMKNQYVRIIDRFTDDASGNGNYVDYSSKVIGIDIVYNVYANGVNAFIINNQLAHAAIQTQIWSSYPTTDMNYEQGVSQPEGVVVHETANYGNDSVSMEMAYAQAHYENAFVHSYVSDGQIVNVANTDYKCWGSGKYGNMKFVQFEQIEVHNKIAFAREINNAAYYTAFLLKEYNIAPSVCVNGQGSVWSHHDVSLYLGGTDHTDPDGYWNKNGNAFFGTGYGMNDFIQLVKYYFDRV